MFHTNVFSDQAAANAYAREDHGEWFVKDVYRDCMGWWKVDLTKYKSLARKK
jgi:hypothetical protein